MPKPSSGIIVVEKPRSTASNTRNSTNTSHTSNTYRQHPHPHQPSNKHYQQHYHQHQQQQHHHSYSHQHNHLNLTSQQQEKQPSKHIQYYDANESPQLSSQQQNQHSTIVLDGRLFQKTNQQQQQQSTNLEEGHKVHTAQTLTSSSPLSLTTSTLTSSSLSLSTTTKSNLRIQAIKAGPMPQATKQLPQQQQQQIIQHTSHNTSNINVGSSNSQQQQQTQQLHYQSSQQQHVQQVHLATTTTSTAQHHQHHHQRQQQPSTQQQQQHHQTHMIQVSEEYLEQAQVQNHTSSNSVTTNMMISATGEVMQQQQIFKIVSTDAATGNMIIDTSGSTQNPNNTNTTTSKVLLSNLTVLSKQQTAAATAAGGQQQSSNTVTGQTINFVNAKQLYTASTATNPASSAGIVSAAATLGKHQKFTVSSANLGSAGGGNFKATALKQTTNTQYVHQTGGSQQKISMTGNRNMQMLTSARLQAGGVNHTGSGVIASSGGGATAQTMVLQQPPHKFVTTNNMNTKSSLGGGPGNILKKNAGTLRMSNNSIPAGAAAANKLMMQAQTPQGVKTFITQATAANAQQNHSSQLSSMQQQQLHAKGSGGKSKFVKQYNNAILNSAGAVAIATLPHQQQQLHQNTGSGVGQQQQSLQGQTAAYMNHHKSSAAATAGGTTTTKINKISSKYATANVAAQLPPGTQLHQKTLGQQQQQTSATPNQPFQTASAVVANNNNSNIKFVNAQGTIIQQQQTLTTQKIHIKQQQHHTSYPNLQQQNFDTVDGNSNHFSPQHITAPQSNNTATNAANSLSPTSGIPNSSNASQQLNDDIMMVNGTQMTDELSARILQSMSQKSFINQRYQQLQQQQHQPPVVAFQKSSTTTNNNNNSSSSSSSSNINMLPPPQTANATATANNSPTPHQTSAAGASSSHHVHVNNPNNHSNILLSPREYTLYPPVLGSSSGITQQQQQSSSSPQQQQHQPHLTQTQSATSPNHYNSSNTSSASPGIASVLTTQSSQQQHPPLSVNNYMANSMATITPHSMAGSGSSRLAQSAPNSRSQSMERKLHESSMSRKSTEYYKVNIKDYHQKCTTFVAPTAGTIYATNSFPTAATSLIDFIIPLPSCTTITTTNTLITSTACSATVNNNNYYNNTNINYNNNNMSNCAAMTTTITSSSNNNNNHHHYSNHNSLRGSHSNLAAAAATSTAQGSAAHTAGHNVGGAANIAALSSPSSTPLSSSLTPPVSATTSSNSMGSSNVMQGTSLPSRRPSIPPPSPMLVEPQAQVIHLQATKTIPGANTNNASNDNDDIIGEEVRPVPVETHDIRLQILHAVLLDHTYANPMPLELPTTFAVQQTPLASSQVNASGAISHNQQQHQQWSLGGIGAVATAVGGNSPNVPTTNYPMYSSQLSRLQQDDDAYSAISNSSRPALGDIDPGEETETAPEAEAEDDSITRCICDLTHDDGYMICCDKCCAWQHVDCMGIDRQNIPDEYLCELCQPRPVDKARARSLQVQKRKEQTQLMLVQAQAAAAGATGAAGSASGAANLANMSSDVLAGQQRLSAGGLGVFGINSSNTSDPAGLHQLTTGGTNMKKGSKVLKKVKESVAGKKSKKADKLSAAGSGLAGKAGRKETKKNTKRKKAGHDGSTVGMTAAEKHAANLQQWINHYEFAVTNHYSPELRARLHAITKQPSLLQSILNTENPILKKYSMGNLTDLAATVPHAGTNILISNLDITPNSPICELRGKYMLTTQYKTQNASMNMNNPPPNNYQLASYKAHKTPGPFIFFYQLQGAEMAINPSFCGGDSMAGQTTTTTTINPDGTFTTTTTTLPAQLSPPPTYLRGPEICVDTRTYGNDARFVRRSCRPNAEIQHLFEKGTIHLFIVALTDIRARTEITIRHEPHDLLAVDNKKTTTMVIQPTSTPCACGLTKDCIFGPPLPQLPPAAKSNAGRKSLALNGGGSSAGAIGVGGGNQSAKQRKVNQQNLNRNRSTSSSGDSNMGGSMTPMTPTIPTVALSLNSPNNLLGNKMGKNPLCGSGSNAPMALMPLTGSCNSNLSNASSSSSTLTSIMPDSGICTSSSSPSVSIPSPTPHMHSPIQQQQSIQNPHLSHSQHQQQQQLQAQTQLQLRPGQIVVPPHQQQQQLMQSLPTPLILTTDMQQPMQQQHHEQQPAQQQPQVLLQSPQHPVQQQPLTVIAQAATATLISQEQPEQPTGHLHITTAAPPPQLISQMSQQPQQQLQLISPQLQQHHHQPTMTVALPPCSGDGTAASPEATIAASALQSLNCSQPGNLTPTMEHLQATQVVVMSGTTAPTATEMKLEEPTSNVAALTPQPLNEGQHVSTQEMANSTSLIATAAGANANVTPSSACSSANSSPQQKSPLKNNQSVAHAMHPSQQGRKTPAKYGRTTSFSEDNDGQHNDENAVSATPNSSSTPKEKPKLSREDRKMEAILKAIEKMERNQKRKLEQKQTKRQNSSSHNTTPTSPNKTFDSADSSGTKRSNSQTAGGGPTRTKKKRKAGNRGAAHNNQRKRRQSRMNSQESIDGCGPHENDTVTSESDGCAAMHSPPIQTMASLKESPEAAPLSIPVPLPIPTHNTLSCETITNNVDQAAGLLMAFANPPIVNTTTETTAVAASELASSVTVPEPQSPQRPEYTLSSHENATSPPATPPSHVSSACLLIEAAVGPLESNLETISPVADVNAEFKYPLQAKTKKLLMNNWLHRTEESAAAVEQTSPQYHQSQPLAPQLVVGCVTGGLDSLVQAAFNDFEQTQPQEPEVPQNLSMVARVEEFIQQTEGGPPTPPPTKHSYDYEHQQQQMYNALASPAVDLSVKQHHANVVNSSNNVAAKPSAENNRKNFHLPLQVSTCSNNSSVKKRWLRQAISEETHEEAQNSSYSMSPSPTTPSMAPVANTSFVANPLSANQVQAIVNPIQCSPAVTTTNSVPNGFTTPLKKRRLLLTDDKEEEDNVTMASSTGELIPNTPMSPPPVEPAIMVQPDTPHNLEEYEEKPQMYTLDSSPALPEGTPQEAQEDVDVDVEKCEQNETMLVYQQNPHKIEQDQEQEQDVDVTSPPFEEQVKAEVVTKHETEDLEIKEEPAEKHHAAVSTIVGCQPPAEFNDQEDDVDILRSPSPGREMIKAEDNLVKIEPEDTSGNEDVKIDVEREESMPADDVVVEPPVFKREYKEEVASTPPVEVAEETIKVENVEVKQELKMEKLESIPQHSRDHELEILPQHIESKTESVSKVEGIRRIKEEERPEEMEEKIVEPKAKRIKLEETEQQSQRTVIVVKNEANATPPPLPSTEEVKLEPLEKAVSKPKGSLETGDAVKTEKLLTVSEEVSSSTSSAAIQVTKVAADSTFSGIESSTPPPPIPSTTTPTQAVCSSSVSSTPPLQRSKPLSDDDIQARVHNFHKENILFLQSRNKKTKSSNSSTSSNALVNSNSGSSSEHQRNNHKSHSSSSSSANHHHHHHHHHHESGKERSEKSDKLSSKHHKTSSSSSSSSSGSSKKQKLHKRERTTSSSSSNSHKNSSSQISSSTSAQPSKNAVINSSTNSLSSSASCSSSKKLKSLKKSSSGSSTSSNNSSSSSSTPALQNCHSSSTDSNKDSKHQRQRTSSNNSSTAPLNAATSSSVGPQPQPPFGAVGSSKKRQLNFELELTKDLHLVNSVVTTSGKHKRQAEDVQGHVSAKKPRKDSTSLLKEEQKNVSNKNHHKTCPTTATTTTSTAHVEKTQEKKAVLVSPVNVTTTTSSVPLKPSPNNAALALPKQTENPPIICTSPAQEVKRVASHSITPPAVVNILREHPTLPHFNNVVLTSTTSSSLTLPAVTPAVQLQPPPPTPPAQNIPVHVTNPGCAVPSIQQPMMPAPLPTPTPTATSLTGNGISSPLLPTTPSAASVNAGSHLPFFNTIYGKLLDNPTPILSSPVSTPASAVSSITTSANSVTPSVLASTGVLSEYLDTKLKSYNTLGGYVTHTALYGLNNAPSKDISTCSLTKDATNEMPAPPAPSAASASLASSSSSSLSLTLNASTSPAMKILTKTASHDPRLNPQLTAPEPPPQPKRKLSINEYRKRMQQTSSNESASNSLASTPTTPPTPQESPTLGAVVLNKCTLNSPERLTQSVDSQIQKEIIASSSLNVYDSLNSSNSSSTSNSSLLNDSLLKSSSLVEEDSTKGQFNAAPTLLEKQQESLCARLKSLKEKQGLALGVGSGGAGSRSRFSSFSESVGIGEYSLRKDDDDLDLLGKRNLSISSSIGAGDLLDNCLEEISSTSTSMSSSREPSPDRYIHTTTSTTNHYQHQSKHVLTASATTTMAATATTTISSSGSSGNSNNSGGHTKQQHHHTHSTSDKSSNLSTNLERKKSVDIA